MGKKGGSSWLTAVKRAFRSPSKDSSEKKTNKKTNDHSQEHDHLDDDDDKVCFSWYYLSLLDKRHVGCLLLPTWLCPSSVLI